MMPPQHPTMSRRSCHQSMPVLSHAGAASEQQSPAAAVFSFHHHATPLPRGTTGLAFKATMFPHDHKINRRTTARPRSLLNPYWTIGHCDCWWGLGQKKGRRRQHLTGAPGTQSSCFLHYPPHGMAKMFYLNQLPFPTIALCKLKLAPEGQVTLITPTHNVFLCIFCPNPHF